MVRIIRMNMETASRRIKGAIRHRIEPAPDTPTCGATVRAVVVHKSYAVLRDGYLGYLTESSLL